MSCIILIGLTKTLHYYDQNDSSQREVSMNQLTEFPWKWEGRIPPRFFNYFCERPRVKTASAEAGACSVETGSKSGCLLLLLLRKINSGDTKLPNQPGGGKLF